MSWTVLSLGGSLISPNKPDIQFLSNFRRMVLGMLHDGHRFIIICGGGHTCRIYQDAALGVSRASNEDLDRIGIQATRLNAWLIKTMFEREAHTTVITPDQKPDTTAKPVIVASGWKPGRSTDYGSVLLAKNFGARTIYNLTNVDYVYDKDPKRSRNAKPIPKLTWDEFSRFTPKGWSPGMYSPFDPVAAKLAQELGFKVVVVNGKNFPNLRSCLEGGSFKGTVIG